jgi:hypothetical protein
LATKAIEQELARRTAIDGIPRHVSVERGTIMKCDWELASEHLDDVLEGEALEQHIAKLMAEQINE